jgi:hypothetical protein
MLGKRSAAFAGSFAIYSLPLVGPHAVWLLGEHLYAGISSDGHRDTAWVAVEIAIAIGAQTLLGLTLLWVLSRRSMIRAASLVAIVAILVVTLEQIYMVTVPSYFLIEPDIAAEQSPWPEECFLPRTSLAAVRTAPDLPLERAARAWVSSDDARSLWLLESCDRRLPLDLGGMSAQSIAPFVLANGAALFAVWEPGAARSTWWLLPRPDGEAAPLALAPPAGPHLGPGEFVALVLSNDGESVAWKQRVAGETTTPLPEEVVVLSLRGGRRRVIRLPDPGRASVVLLGVDTIGETLTVFEHDYRSRSNAISKLGFDGTRRTPPLVAEGVDAQSTTFLQVGDGWAAWDAYRDEGRYRIAWSLPAGKGSKEVPLGRAITSLDVDPTGSYIAVSTTTTLNIGQIRDCVSVLRTKDGAEVFRRYLPTYSRSRVAFVGSSRFAYDDRRGETFGLRMLRIGDVGAFGAIDGSR